MVISPTGYHGKPSTICYCWPVSDEYGETANARLIAAAPELLAALKRVKETGVYLGAIPQEMVDEAIAKAEGKP